ncbi:Cobalt-precorrin-5B C(1)-methyltransferase [Tenacibaculum litopenaei]|uniref:cobalt-precorrin-5B (C(1))-methyltransferase n=1 Tax=Tenacibaculum litopenaei TaxID=396016 RepID=UPI0038935955
MSELQDIPNRPLRSGYTTGACATAATKAALWMLATGKNLTEVSIVLPKGQVASFTLHKVERLATSVKVTVIKDAGDDPDVTNKAAISAEVSWNGQGDIIFERGEGVGLVTLPGLEIAVGEPAINPVPRKMIRGVCQKIQADFQYEKRGVTVKISVKDGEKLAKRTLNSRLGIIGGISILGTTGIVTPFSAASYIASIHQGIDVAIANGQDQLMINSGGRSEKALKQLFPTIHETACIHYGNWIGATFEKINKKPQVRKVLMGIMLGKAAKLAKGMLDTHSAKASWDKEFIYQLAVEAGYSTELATKVLDLNMAGRLRELFTFEPEEPFYQKLLEKCFQNCVMLAPDTELELYLINNNNQTILYKKR